MNTAAPALPCPSCGQLKEPSSVLPVACPRCRTVMPGQVPPIPSQMPPLRAVPPSAIVAVPTEPAGDLPDGLLAELVETNGGQPVTPALVRLVWMLGDLLVDARQELGDIAEVLELHSYLDAFDPDAGLARPLCRAVQDAVNAAEERQAVSGVLTSAGFYPSGQSLPDVVEEVVALATDGEEAFALLLDSGFMPDSYLVRDALRTALAAAAASAGSLKELEESYELQQEGIQVLAGIARRALTTAHGMGDHVGDIYDCADCVSDMVRIHLLSGFSI